MFPGIPLASAPIALSVQTETLKAPNSSPGRYLEASICHQLLGNKRGLVAAEAADGEPGNSEDDQEISHRGCVCCNIPGYPQSLEQRAPGQQLQKYLVLPPCQLSGPPKNGEELSGCFNSSSPRLTASRNALSIRLQHVLQPKAPRRSGF